MTKKYISIIAIAILIIFPVMGLVNVSKAQVDASVLTYLESINPQTDWTVMARKALGGEVSDASFLQELDGENANDYSSYILAITALGEDPRSFGNENLIYGLRQLSSNGQIGDEQYLNDDIFALIALRSAGVRALDSLVAQEVQYIKSKQTNDKGWSWDASATEAMVDYTAMGIMALLSSGVQATDSSIVNAVDYLANAQNDNGGFGMTSSDASNTASTAWALSAIYALGDDINFYKPAALTPVDYLNNMLHADGYFLFDENSAAADQFTPITSSYAAIALSGKYYPVSTIIAPSTVSLRIEGIESTVCLLDNAIGATALDVIKASSDECGYEYIIEQYDWGPYLTTIAGDTAAGMDGWIFAVNHEHLQVGANQFNMTEDDALVVYYGAWDSKLLRVSHDQSSVEIGDTTTATVERYDAGAWSALSDATLKRGTDSFVSDANGQVNLSWPEDGAYYLYAEAEASVRSSKVLVISGDSGESQTMGMSVTIEQDDSGAGGNGNNDQPEQSNVIFGVSGDLSFGTLKPGQSLTKQATISNTGSNSISTTATVEGTSLFTNNIYLDNVAPIQWQKIISSGAQSGVDVTLSVPQSYSASGAEQGTLIFWANAVQN